MIESTGGFSPNSVNVLCSLLSGSKCSAFFLLGLSVFVFVFILFVIICVFVFVCYYEDEVGKYGWN